MRTSHFQNHSYFEEQAHTLHISHYYVDGSSRALLSLCITNPVDIVFCLRLTSVIGEIWFGFSWILDQLPKCCPVNREAYVDRLITWYA
jgi:hypothetical protein